jgi:hypothetical protein
VKRKRLPGDVRLKQPSNFSYYFYCSNWSEITCNDFSASFGFRLCGLQGFPRIWGLDRIFEGEWFEGR